MKIGIAVPNIGPVATPEAVKTVAQHAEALGYHSLWTVERLLWPVNPRTPYPATTDGSLPEEYKYCLDPLDVTAAAVVAAVQAYCKINAMGHWVDRSEHVNLNELFERMPREEMEAYAREGTLPAWFEEAVGATDTNSRETPDEQ